MLVVCSEPRTFHNPNGPRKIHRWRVTSPDLPIWTELHRTFLSHSLKGWALLHPPFTNRGVDLSKKTQPELLVPFPPDTYDIPPDFAFNSIRTNLPEFPQLRDDHLYVVPDFIFQFCQRLLRFNLAKRYGTQLPEQLTQAQKSLRLCISLILRERWPEITPNLIPFQDLMLAQDLGAREDLHTAHRLGIDPWKYKRSKRKDPDPRSILENNRIDHDIINKFMVLRADSEALRAWFNEEPFWESLFRDLGVL